MEAALFYLLEFKKGNRKREISCSFPFGSMADPEPSDPIPPAFWPPSPSPYPSLRGSGSRSERDSSPFDSLGLGAGLGLGVHSHHQDHGGSIPRSESESTTSDLSRACSVGDGRQISGFGSGSDSDSDEQIVAIANDSNLSSPRMNLIAPLFWDCLRIDGDRRDLSEEFEWEEIDEEREVVISDHELEIEAAANVEWEVLLMNLGHGDDAESFLDEGFVYATSDYDEVAFAQFQEHGDGLKGSLPAAKSAVENLSSFVLTREDVEKRRGCLGCAVCKDEILVQEKAKRLPCSHCYHDECILPWLGMRNTCPLCRYELPTDDPEYESWKARRAGIEADESFRYGFEMLPDHT